MDISNIISIAKTAGYSHPNKVAYRKLSTQWLRDIAKQLQLNPNQFEISFNPGGVAVAGNAILHHDHFYISLNELGCYWRTCQGRKDYTGGPNQRIFNECGFKTNFSNEKVVDLIKKHLATKT